MLTRASLLGGLALAALAGCSAATDEGSTTEESQLTERKIVSHVTYVTGNAASYKSDAETSLAAACADVAARQKAIAGAKFVDAICGASTNIATGSNYLMGATVTTRFSVDIVDGKAPASLRTTTLTGDSSSYASDATASWAKACAAELERAKTLFGDRLLGGGCDAPKNMVHGSNFVMGAPFHAFVMAAKGPDASITAAVVGESKTYESDGLAAWKTACEAWGKKAAARSGAHLANADCGEPTNIAPGASFVFASTATLAAASDDANAPIASGGLFTAGASSTYFSDGLVAWQAACDADFAIAKELLGDRLLASGCAQAKQLSTGSNFVMGAPSPIVTASAGATKLVVDGYVFSESASYSSDAQASIGKTSAAELRLAVARVGASRIEGLEVAKAANVSVGSNFLYGAKTKLLLGLDLPAGSEPVSSMTTVQVRAPYQGDAAAAWMKACDQAADKAKMDYGARFAAASCGEPTYDGNGTYSSPMTTWIVP